jgi:transposase-like protein
LNASNRAELVAAYASGTPASDLAARFGVHRSTVWKLAFQAGLVTRRPELSDEVRAEAARLYESGFTLVQVSERFGISDEGVRSAVVAVGGTIRPRGRRRLEAL